MKQYCSTKRLKARMALLEISQTELARRVGCSPAAMARVIQGQTQRSRLLPDIARILGTSVEYLIGESNEPSKPHAASVASSLTIEEQHALSNFRALSAPDRQVVVRVVECLARSPERSVSRHSQPD
ncbi:helix-turn-helix domain-containing protein [Croceibacterium ferulae]|uniref:helix-turn-helix domain-containing protein n=1 Tax=Croceibacterium ferulae TaxID=1854641 RepID=UPI003BAA774E